MVLFSGIETHCRNFRQRVLPHLFWLVRRSETVIDSASHGERRITSAALTFPTAILRLRSARASRTALARSRAWRCCGPGDILASACIGSSHALRSLGGRAPPVVH